jgi:hypothetical protein
MTAARRRMRRRNLEILETIRFLFKKIKIIHIFNIKTFQ